MIQKLDFTELGGLAWLWDGRFKALSGLFYFSAISSSFSNPWTGRSHRQGVTQATEMESLLSKHVMSGVWVNTLDSDWYLYLAYAEEPPGMIWKLTAWDWSIQGAMVLGTVLSMILMTVGGAYRWELHNIPALRAYTDTASCRVEYIRWTLPRKVGRYCETGSISPSRRDLGMFNVEDAIPPERR